MFGEGHAKWQLYKFMHEDRERVEAMQRDRNLVTGSVRQPAYTVQTSPNGIPRARRPGERGVHGDDRGAAFGLIWRPGRGVVAFGAPLC